MRHPTLMLYLLAGLVVAASLWKRSPGSREASQVLLQLVFWPMFLPMVLALAHDATPRMSRSAAERIDDAERRLLWALGALGRQLGDSLKPEAARVRALTEAMRLAAMRAYQLEGTLLQPGFDLDALATDLEGLRAAHPEGGAVVEAAQARLAEVGRLRALWDAALADLDLALLRAEAVHARLLLLRLEPRSDAASAAQRAGELGESVDELCRLLGALPEGASCEQGPDRAGQTAQAAG